MNFYKYCDWWAATQLCEQPHSPAAIFRNATEVREAWQCFRWKMLLWVEDFWTKIIFQVKVLDSRLSWEYEAIFYRAGCAKFLPIKSGKMFSNSLCYDIVLIQWVIAYLELRLRFLLVSLMINQNFIRSIQFLIKKNCTLRNLIIKIFSQFYLSVEKISLQYSKLYYYYEVYL